MRDAAASSRPASVSKARGTSGENTSFRDVAQRRKLVVSEQVMTHAGEFARVSTRYWQRCAALIWRLGVVAAVGCHASTAGNPTPSVTSAPTTAHVPAETAASDLPRTFATPIRGDDMGVTVHRLSNGMTVYISTDRQQPRFSAWIAVRAGSRHDPADSTGLAHYLEHMLFKGSRELGTLDYAAERVHVERVEQAYRDLAAAKTEAQRREILALIDRETQAQAKFAIPNEFDRLYTRLGVTQVNAFTSDDMTVYTSDVPANHLSAWATTESERFRDPVFRLFYPELEAVYEEKNLALDSADDRVFEALHLALYPRHPYGTQPTIGTVEHLKLPAYDDMAQYFANYYVANNMAIVLAGDIDPQTALPELERTFAGLRTQPVAAPPPADVVGPRGRVLREVVGEGEQSVTIAWRTVPVGHSDHAALEVMDWLVDNARTGLLNVELELAQKVPQAWSGNSLNNDAGHFVVSASAKQGQPLTEVESLLHGVIAKLKRGEITQKALDAVVLHQRISEKQQLESREARVSKMAMAFLRHLDWDEVLERDRRRERVKLEDVVQVANRYLDDDYVVVRRVTGKPELPKIDKPAITPVPLDASRQSEFAKRVLQLPAPELQPVWVEAGKQFVRSEIASGPLVAVANTRNDLFQLSYVFDRGYRDEGLLCLALELLELSGAAERSAETFRKQLHALGTEVSVHCNADGSGISLAGIEHNLAPSLALVREWLAAPTFTDVDVVKLREVVLSRRKDQLESPDVLEQAVADFAAYGKQSAWLEQPSNARIATATPSALRAIIRGFANHRHHVLYFGTRSVDELGGLVTLGRDHRRVVARRPRKFRGGKQPSVVFLDKHVAKSSVFLVLPDKVLAREHRPAAELYTEYLNGNMSSLVFQEIREARGLAYSAAGYYSRGSRVRDQGGLIGRMTTQADKTTEALTMLLALLTQHPLEHDRFAEAKIALEQSYRSDRIDPRALPRTVLAWERLGDATDPRPAVWEAIRTAEPSVVAKFAARAEHVAPSIAVMGDRTRIDMDGLAKLGKVVEVQPADLFGYGPFP